MAEQLPDALSHVYWIGGAPDSGKTSVAAELEQRLGTQVYNYDRSDAVHHLRLSQNRDEDADFLTQSLDERWLRSTPGELFDRAVRSFQKRFPFMLEDLLALPKSRPIIAEGFGLLPDLLAPLLSSRRNAIWLIPTDTFKRTSILRRNKPSFRLETSDPDRARNNLVERDAMLADFVRRQAQERNLKIVEVDGSKSIGQMANLVGEHFELLVQP